MYTEAGHPEVYADPLMVLPVLALLEESMEDVNEGGSPLIVSYADAHKAEMPLDYGVDREYSIRYPNPAADAMIEGLWYQATFVGYLRKNFQWGGFPGWERYTDRPEKELAFLREGLLPI